MTTTPSRLTTATMLCAEYREHWCKQPGNQRPPIHDHAANLDWWTRWMASPEKAHCDNLMREALGAYSAVGHQPDTENAVAGHWNAKKHHSRPMTTHRLPADVLDIRRPLLRVDRPS